MQVTINKVKQTLSILAAKYILYVGIYRCNKQALVAWFVGDHFLLRALGLTGYV